LARKRRKLSGAEKAAKKKRREEYMTIFVGGKQKRVRRPPMIDGMSVDEFIRKNADPIFLHQEGLWEYLEMPENLDPPIGQPVMREGRESVSFISVEDGDDLIVAFAIELMNTEAIASLILHRMPPFEYLLPAEEQGVRVSHELFSDEDRAVARRIVVAGSAVDIETAVRTYVLDVSRVDQEEIDDAVTILHRMSKHGTFVLEIR
jgi:hypothetical protein